MRVSIARAGTCLRPVPHSRRSPSKSARRAIRCLPASRSSLIPPVASTSSTSALRPPIRRRQRPTERKRRKAEETLSDSVAGIDRSMDESLGAARPFQFRVTEDCTMLNIERLEALSKRFDEIEAALANPGRRVRSGALSRARQGTCDARGYGRGIPRVPAHLARDDRESSRSSPTARIPTCVRWPRKKTRPARAARRT